MVEEAEACCDLCCACSVEVYFYVYICFFCCPCDFCGSFSGEQYFGYFVPCYSLRTEDKRCASKVLCKLAVGFSVANNVASRNVVGRVIDVVSEHSCCRLAHGRVFVWEVAVDELFVKCDAFALKCLKDEVVDRIEMGFGESGGSEPVLVGNHDEPEVELLCYEAEVFKYAFDEFKLFERVYLFVLGFFDDCSVAVDEEYFLHVVVLFFCGFCDFFLFAADSFACFDATVHVVTHKGAP